MDDVDAHAADDDDDDRECVSEWGLYCTQNNIPTADGGSGGVGGACDVPHELTDGMI